MIGFKGERWIQKCRADPSIDEAPSFQSPGASAFSTDEGRTGACTVSS